VAKKITEIESIGPAYAVKLEESGIKSQEQLLVNATNEWGGASALAESSGNIEKLVRSRPSEKMIESETSCAKELPRFVNW